MSPENDANFISLRRALKISSYLGLVYAVVKVPVAAVAVGRTGVVYTDMAGGRPLPPVFGVADFLRDNFLYLLPIALVVLVVALVITRRSKGGIFLYVNLGLMLLFFGFVSYLSSAGTQALSSVLEGFAQ